MKKLGKVIKSRLNNTITQEFLKSLLLYKPETGIFTWKIRVACRVHIGDRAGCLDRQSGYTSIEIKGIKYKAHRLAWLYMTGEWPEHEVDHKDLNRSNNKWVNLRQATQNQNMRNKGPHKNNTSGYKGVTKASHTTWKAQIVVNGTLLYLGNHKSPKLAHVAYCEAAKEHHKNFARTT